MQADCLRMQQKTIRYFKVGGGVKDDGPDEGKFCHRTIRVLCEVGVDGYDLMPCIGYCLLSNVLICNSTISNFEMQY